MSKRPSQQPCSGIGRSDGLSYRKYSLKFHLIISIYNLVRAELRRLWLAVRGGRIREQGAAAPRRVGVQRPGWMSVGVCCVCHSVCLYVCIVWESECVFVCMCVWRDIKKIEKWNILSFEAGLYENFTDFDHLLLWNNDQGSEFFLPHSCLCLYLRSELRYSNQIRSK